jgi:hypothetical protein
VPKLNGKDRLAFDGLIASLVHCDRAQRQVGATRPADMIACFDGILGDARCEGRSGLTEPVTGHRSCHGVPRSRGPAEILGVYQLQPPGYPLGRVVASRARVLPPAQVIGRHGHGPWHDT